MEGNAQYRALYVYRKTHYCTTLALRRGWCGTHVYCPRSLLRPTSPHACIVSCFKRWKRPCCVMYFMYNSKIGFTQSYQQSHSCWAASRVTDLLLPYSSQFKSQLCGCVICLGDLDAHFLSLSPSLSLSSSLSLAPSPSRFLRSADLDCHNYEGWWAYNV